MTTSMEDTATKLVTIHHDEAAEIPRRKIGLAGAPIGIWVGYGVGKITPANGKCLQRSLAPSVIGSTSGDVEEAEAKLEGGKYLPPLLQRAGTSATMRMVPQPMKWRRTAHLSRLSSDPACRNPSVLVKINSILMHPNLVLHRYPSLNTVHL